MEQPLLLDLEREGEWIEPSSKGWLPGTPSGGVSPVSRMNMRTFLQGLSSERGPLRSALLDFATSAGEEVPRGNAFCSPVEEFFHDNDGGLTCESNVEALDLERGETLPDVEPPSFEVESQETSYTLNVADSCVSTKGSSVDCGKRMVATERNCLNIIVESKEWGAMCSSAAVEDSVPLSRHRSPRHAATIEVNSPKASAEGMDPNLLRCLAWCFFFLEMWMSSFCIGLCAMRLDWPLTVLLALPHGLLVGMEVQLIKRDWAYRRNLQALEEGSYAKALFFKTIVFLIFGWFSCLPVMRARQCWQRRGMRSSLVDEIETPSVTESCRLDSHVMFVTNVPRIMVLLFAATRRSYSDLSSLCLLLPMALLSLTNVLQAAINFDFYASKWIRSEYETSKKASGSIFFRFQALHVSYRLCEILMRMLTLLMVLDLRFPSFSALYLCLDYLLGTMAFLAVTPLTPGSSRMVLILSVSIYVFDCCRFIDQQGLCRQAKRLSTFLRTLRGSQALLLPLLLAAREQFNLKLLGPSIAIIALLVGALLLERYSRLKYRAVDIFMASSEGLVKELESLLDGGCDCNLRLCDNSSKTPLHLAAGCGQSECVELLLKRGADPLLCDVDGETALHRACRKGHARCIRMLLHPPEDAPCVMRGDYLECTVQVNKAGERPWHLLKEPNDLMEELGKFQNQPDLKRSLSLQPSSPSRSVSGELSGEAQSVFGQVLQNSESRFLVSSSGANLTGFLFSTGIGEQMAEVLDQLQQVSPRLTTLRTQGVLGAGSFGKVFKVLDVCSAEVYALKLQRRDSTTKFAIREAQALHRSSHAFIVRLIHIFQTQSYYALLMELCDKSLNACILDHVDSSGQIGLTEEATKRYAACITLALEYLHHQKVVFRDLKPDNVLITFKDDVAKLADFGLARSLALFLEEPTGEKLSPTASSTVCGTPRFMAPEVYEEFMMESEDEEDALRRLLSRDWYALGCCLLLMLLGQEAGSLAEANGRRVLLPPSGQAEITCTLRKASKKGWIDEDALFLIDGLAAPVEVRFEASDLRRQSFLSGAIQEMECFT